MCKPEIKQKKPVTLQELKDCIPKHCWERSALHSGYYLMRDIVCSIIVTFIYINVVPEKCPSDIISALGWFAIQLLWIWVQGSIWMGVWVIGHECGHHAFSESDLLSDVVGYVIHSALLVPYFSWQYTHSRHHKNNNHMLDNETHLPSTRSGFAKSGFKKLAEILGEEGFALFHMWAHLVPGWPMYILFGTTGCRRTPHGKRVKGLHSHFFPNRNAFHASYPDWKVWMSTLGCCITLFGLYQWYQVRGLSEVLRHYIGPYMVVNAWLVIITWLQHTNPRIPHYGEGEWTWLKGAKCTIDRDTGIYEFFNHYICSSHVCHHLFSQIPFYNAPEATIHLKKVLGDEYMYDPDHWTTALYKASRDCLFVEEVNGVQHYKGYDAIDFKNSKKKA